MRSTEGPSSARSGHAPGHASGHPSRHARVWLDPLTWRAHLSSSYDANTLAVLDEWIAKGRPAVSRRREGAAAVDGDGVPAFVCGDDDDERSLAIALPLAAGRARIAFVVRAQAVVRVEAPLTLAEASATAPAEWRECLRDLATRGLQLDTEFRVYGSLAWQHITGETCVTPRSDVDLLWTASDREQIAHVLEALVAWERDSGIRADGEMLLADGAAVAWRELLGDCDRVLVKTDDGVAIRPSPLRVARPPQVVEAA